MLQGTSSPNIRTKSLDLANILFELMSNKSWLNLNSYLEFIQCYAYDTINIVKIEDEIFMFYSQAIILCVTNGGIFGVDNINQEIEIKVKCRFGVSQNTWYVGRPIIILENNYNLGLYNGDIGICIIKDGVYVILFEDGRTIVPSILPKYKLAYAITIHKSQGSEYDNVIIILPTLKPTENVTNSNPTQNLITKQLLYTAITRAKYKVMLYADMDIIKGAISRDFNRQTGLYCLLDSLKLD